MSEPFAYHLFAHRSGRYQTLTSLGISEAEAKALEQFFFGQTNNEAYLASLQDEPGVIWRTIDGRGALTRVRKGHPDSHGRATLQFETLLIQPSGLSGFVNSLASNVVADWEVRTDGAFIVQKSPTKVGTVHPARLSDVLMNVRAGKQVVRRAKDFSLADVAKIISSCTDDPTFTLCYKCLNATAPVRANLVSLDIGDKTMLSPQSRSAQDPTSRPSLSLSTRRPAHTNPLVLLAVCVVLLLQCVMMWLTLRSPRQPTGLDEMQKHILDRITAIQNETKVQFDDLREQHKTEVEHIRADFDSRMAALQTTFKEAISPIEPSLKTITSQGETSLAKIREYISKELKPLLDKMQALSTEQQSFNMKLNGVAETCKKLLEASGPQPSQEPGSNQPKR